MLSLCLKRHKILASSNKHRVALFSSSCRLVFVHDLKGGAECELLAFSLIWL